MLRSKKKQAVMAVLAVMAALMASSRADATTSTPQPMPYSQAMPLINAPGSGGQGPVTAVSSQTALAAMTQAGASTTVLGYSSPAAAVAASTGCDSVKSWHGWGTWPYNHKINEFTYYCAVYGKRITSYTTTVTTDQTLCSLNDKSSFLYSGGIGQHWITVQATATWNCPIIGIIPYSVTGWIRTGYSDTGHASIAAHS